MGALSTQAMTTRWHIGAKQLRGGIAAYAKRFDLLEVRVGLPVAPGSEDVAPPTLATLRRWRRTVPPHFDFAVVAGPHASRAKPGPQVDAELDAARVAIDALQARCFVLRTPPDVTPTALWRERIARMAARVPRDVTRFIWEPSGVWETEMAAEQARQWDVVLAVDPAREPVPAGSVAYLRLRALGETRAFSEAALERVVKAVGARREVFAIIETDSAAVEVKRLRRLARSGGPGKVGGGARLVRPRGAIIVRDDEQE
ncbi:MAG TPA: DUF72 domain-containing protein [Polyangiaceae bacterium]|nr:DUF72 domain-containing protein [Polyangiaceae bacterium]